jgi:hypothetical protein
MKVIVTLCDRKVASGGGWVRTKVIVTPWIDSINPPLRIFIDESTLPYLKGDFRSIDRFVVDRLFFS